MLFLLDDSIQLGGLTAKEYAKVLLHPLGHTGRSSTSSTSVSKFAPFTLTPLARFKGRTALGYGNYVTRLLEIMRVYPHSPTGETLEP